MDELARIKSHIFSDLIFQNGTSNKPHTRRDDACLFS